MKRREAIEKTGWILKSAIFTPGLVSAIQSCQPKVNEANSLLVLDTNQFELSKSLADTILPSTETASASDVKVSEFLDVLLSDVFTKESIDHMISGLNQFDTDCESTTGKPFIKLDEKSRISYLNRIDQEVMSENYEDEVPFYFTFKNLVITIYFSSEKGMKQNLNYQPIPGSFLGDVALKAGEKIAVGNQM